MSLKSNLYAVLIMVLSVSIISCDNKKVSTSGETEAQKKLEESQLKVDKLEKELAKAQEAAKEAAKKAKESEKQSNKIFGQTNALIEELDQKQMGHVQKLEVFKLKEIELEAKTQAFSEEQSDAKKALQLALDEKVKVEALIKESKSELSIANSELDRVKIEVLAKDAESAEKQRVAELNLEKAKSELQSAIEKNKKADERIKEADLRVAQAEKRLEELKKAGDLVRELFVKLKLDPVFDKVSNDQEIVVRISLVGISKSENLIKIREKIKNVNLKESYKDLVSLVPNTLDAESVVKNDKQVARFKRENSNFDATVTGIIKSVSPVTVNDVYMVSGKAQDIKNIRDEVNNASVDEGNNLLVIVRLVEKVRVGIQMKVKARKSYAETFDENSKAKIVKFVRLGYENLENIESLDSLEIKNPATFIFGQDNSCETVSSKCLKKLKEKGLLNKALPFATGRLKEVVSHYLKRTLDDSVNQLGLDLTFVNKTHDESFFLKPDFLKDKKYRVNEDMKKEYLTEEEASVEVDHNMIVESIELKYNVTMVEKLQSNGLVYVDTVLNKGIGGTSIEDIGRGEVEMSLPVSSTNSSKLNIKELSDSEAEKLNLSNKGKFIRSTMKQSTILENMLEALK